MDALYDMGASVEKFENITWRSTYICVGEKGLGKGNGFEAFHRHYVELEFTLYDGELFKD